MVAAEAPVAIATAEPVTAVENRQVPALRLSVSFKDDERKVRSAHPGGGSDRLSVRTTSSVPHSIQWDEDVIKLPLCYPQYRVSGVMVSDIPALAREGQRAR